jgi:hypothetical protein
MSLSDFYRFLAEIQILQAELEKSIGGNPMELPEKVRQRSLDGFSRHRQDLDRDIRGRLDALEVMAHENGFVFCRISRFLTDDRVRIGATFGERKYPRITLPDKEVPDGDALHAFLRKRYNFMLGTKLFLVIELYVCDSASSEAEIPTERRFHQHIYSS